MLQRHADEIDGAARAHALFDCAEIGFVRLRQIGGEGDDLDTLLRQPMRNGATVESAGCRESNRFSLKVVNVHKNLLKRALKAAAKAQAADTDRTIKGEKDVVRA
jgi:hypothetical protein